MKGLSGNAYVAAYARDEWQQPVGVAMWNWKHGTRTLPLAGKREACYIGPDGKNRSGPGYHADYKICTRCAYSWNWDYQLLLWRTAGGRALAQRLWENGVDMTQFHGYTGVVTGKRNT